jgi:hypothetical protein
MNEKILNVEEIMMVFDLFIDEMLKGAISFDDYLPGFREMTGVDENSPMELMFRGFIGGLHIARESELVGK